MFKSKATIKIINSILARTLSYATISFCMLYFSYLSLIEPDETLAIRYLAIASVSFSLTLIGYWGYCRYYASKHEHSPIVAILYTLFFGFVFLLSGKFNP